MIKIHIDGRAFEVAENLSAREAALANGVYIPGLCSHPELDAFKAFQWSEEVWQGATQKAHAKAQRREEDFPHCNLCLISVNGGEPTRSCALQVEDGMAVDASSVSVIRARQQSLKKILSRHPHACLTCAQRAGCDRVQCSMNVPVGERCCELLGRCEIGKIADFIGIPADTPPYRNEGRPQITDEPLFIRDLELCVSCLRCVRVCRDVRGVDALGAVSDDVGVWVGTQGGATLPEALCRFCGACVDVCPTGALRDKGDCPPLVDGLAPCVAACPLEIDIPGYMDLISRGLEYEALELIRERAALPGVLGYACFHPCEDSCRRGRVDDGASICALKRYVSDAAGERPAQIVKAQSTGKRIAIIGSGPAGLAAAAELLRAGHDVTVMEQENRIGGMLTQALPEFRLPEAIVQRDLNFLFDLGMKAVTGVSFGIDTNPGALKSGGYDAVLLAVGLSEATRLGIPGEDLLGVSHGLEFLRQARQGNAPHLDGGVVVIGGGSVAVDIAMTARRLDAARVTIICLESESEIPAAKEELQSAIEEGIEILYRWGVKEILGGAQLTGVTLKRCSRVFDEQHRFAPQYDESATTTIACANLIVSIGQRIKPELKPYLKPRDGVYFAGDARTGASSIVAAMADGVRAAKEIDRHLGSAKLADMPQAVLRGDSKFGYLGRDPEFHLRRRQVAEIVPPEGRVAAATVLQSTLTRDQAMEEAARCLRCHLRATLAKSPLPPDPWRPFDGATADAIPNLEGVLIFADDLRKTVRIAGAADLKAAFQAALGDGINAKFCKWELDPMFTKRESELMQAHLQAFGSLPGGGELDELF